MTKRASQGALSVHRQPSNAVPRDHTRSARCAFLPFSPGPRGGINLCGMSVGDDVLAEASHAGVFVMHARSPRLHRHPKVSHTEHGLTFLQEGWFEMEHGERIRAEPRSVTLVPAGAPHRPLAGRDLDFWLLGFCANCVGLDESQPLMAPFVRVRRGALPVLPLGAARWRELQRLLAELLEECRRAAPESAELARSGLVLILGKVLRAMPSASGEAPTGTLAAQALAFIQRECLSPISLAQVAAAVHRSPAHVAASVKSATGHSVGDWIAAGRVAEAAARLTHTDDSLEAIANHVGWKDKTHFIRQFKKLHGATPAAFRRTQRDLHHR